MLFNWDQISLEPGCSPHCWTLGSWTANRVYPSERNSEGGSMSQCEQCSLKFSILRRKKMCSDCGMPICGSCAKRLSGGIRKCHKCVVFTQWPVDMAAVSSLRVRDLRQFLHTHHISTVTCTEKQELTDLVIHQLRKQRGCYQTSDPHQLRKQRGCYQTSGPQISADHYTWQPSSVTRDDGIRVRPSSIFDDFVVVESTEPESPVRTNETESCNQNMEYVRGVFSSRLVNTEEDRPPVEMHSSEIETSGPEESVSTDSSTESVGHDSRDNICCHGAEGKESITGNSSGQTSVSTPVLVVDAPPAVTVSSSTLNANISEEGTDHQHSDELCEVTRRNQLRMDTENVTGTYSTNIDYSGISDLYSCNLEAVDRNEVRLECDDLQEAGSDEEGSPDVEEAHVPAAADLLSSHSEPSSPSTATASAAFFSSATHSAASSPEPSAVGIERIVKLSSLKTVTDVKALTVRQCKELLTLNRVSYSGVREKQELVDRILVLWNDFKKTHTDVENLPDDMVCKICMDAMIDCVLLECGHMVCCTVCGKQMSECPMCRQYVVRVVRTFRA